MPQQQEKRMILFWLCILGVALAPTVALAHDGSEVAGGWSLSPEVSIPLLLLAFAYYVGWRQIQRRTSHGGWGWRAICFYTGVGVLLVALLSPIDTYGDELLTAHMIQHLLLIMVAPPLLVWGSPLVPLLWALPAVWRRQIKTLQRTMRQGGLQGLARCLHWARFVTTSPALVWGVHVVTLWLWHLPRWYEAAVRSEPIHIAEHLTFLISSLQFWWLVIHPLPSRRLLGYGLTVMFLFGAMVQSALLGALMALSRRPWYAIYERVPVRPWGLSAIEDQQLAGLIMWIPAGALYIVAILGVLVAWMRAEQTQPLPAETVR